MLISDKPRKGDFQIAPLPGNSKPRMTRMARMENFLNIVSGTPQQENLVDDGWTDVGAGTIDWKALWPAIAGTGATLLVLEHDNPSDWRSYAAHSYEYVAGLAGGRRH